MSADRRPAVLCVAPFNNPHIVPIYDALAEDKRLMVQRATLRRTPKARIEMGWAEMDPNYPYLQTWRSASARARYLRALATSEIAILPGFFHFRTLPAHHLIRRIARKITALWSEPFLQHPRTLARPRAWATGLRTALAPFNTDRVCLFAAGVGAEDDYRSMGMSRWEYREFSLAVAPHRECQHDREPIGRATRFVFCGAITRRKGTDLLIEAFCRPELAGRDFRLVLIGDGPLRSQLEERCGRHPMVNSKISFLGSLSREACRDELARHDVLVLPSRFDGWGAVVNEAMEANLAVVVSDGVGARRPLVEDGVNGRVFANGSAEALCRALVPLTTSRAKLVAMKQASRERIRRYRPDRVADALAQWCLAKALPTEFTLDDDVLPELPTRKSNCHSERSGGLNGRSIG